MTVLDFDFHIKRSRRKSVGIYVQDGSVEVRAPWYVNQGEIQSFVLAESGWIKQKLAEAHQKAGEKPTLVDGQTFLFLGEPRTLRFELGQPAVSEVDSYIVISHNLFTDVEELFTRWVMAEASRYLDTRVFELAPSMNVADLISGIKYRKTKTKWGHCTSEGKLQFNWLVILAPPEVIDYVIIHELAHLHHLNHSKQFWALVEKYCPDYKTHKKWLSENQHKLWFD